MGYQQPLVTDRVMFLASEMMRLSNLTLRNVLIALHDALATTLALFASFYLRFEGELFLRAPAAAAADPAIFRRVQRGGLLSSST